MKRNIKKPLKNTTDSAMFLLKKTAGFVVQGLKTFWQNWQWAIALVALMYAIFLFYYQSTTSTPARLTNCEKHLAEHIKQSDSRFEKIEDNQHSIEISLAEIKVMVKGATEDLVIIKKSVVENRQ
jgi:hypothetical protein